MRVVILPEHFRIFFNKTLKKLWEKIYENGASVLRVSWWIGDRGVSEPHI